MQNLDFEERVRKGEVTSPSQINCQKGPPIYAGQTLTMPAHLILDQPLLRRRHLGEEMGSYAVGPLANATVEFYFLIISLPACLPACLPGFQMPPCHNHFSRIAKRVIVGQRVKSLSEFR